MRIDSSWSVLPMAPNIIAPRASSLTDMPVPPRILRFIFLFLVFGFTGRSCGATASSAWSP
ncbi:hypothetical protein ACFQX6_64660 [Streptosporangium lutulentum]